MTTNQEVVLGLPLTISTRSWLLLITKIVSRSMKSRLSCVLLNWWFWKLLNFTVFKIQKQQSVFKIQKQGCILVSHLFVHMLHHFKTWKLTSKCIYLFPLARDKVRRCKFVQIFSCFQLSFMPCQKQSIICINFMSEHNQVQNFKFFFLYGCWVQQKMHPITIIFQFNNI